MYELIVMGCFFIVFLNIIFLFSMLADLYGSSVLKVQFPRYKEIKMRPHSIWERVPYGTPTSKKCKIPDKKDSEKGLF